LISGARVRAFCAVLIALASLGWQRTRAQSKEHSYVFGSVLTDAGGRTAGVRILLNGPVTVEAKSIAGGAFAFPPLPPGRYSVVAYCEDRPLQVSRAGSSVAVDRFELQRGAVQEVSVRLDDRPAIRGTIADWDGNPIDRANVVALRLAAEISGLRRFEIAGTAQADDRGEYELWGLNAGTYVFLAKAPLEAFSEPDGAEFVGPTTFFPASPDVRQAQLVSLSLGETQEIDIHVSKVRAYSI
jgi:hypothetical protein